MSERAPDTGTVEFVAAVAVVNDQRLVRLPSPASAALPSRGQVAVSGMVGGTSFRTIVEPDGRRGHWIRLDDRIPGVSGIEADDEMHFVLAPLQQWPEPVVPHDLRRALDDAIDLHEIWQSITPMARWEWVRWVQATANPDTRARRVDASIDKLRTGKRRPCCFDLSSCTDPSVSRSGKLVLPR